MQRGLCLSDECPENEGIGIIDGPYN